ncbi:hypothetical protein HanIR_Chr07g0301451 [Helianthus annuus]|nr:hypothetical protein HanIR_Chr07g0301451 [Helianthus annuus]
MSDVNNFLLLEHVYGDLKLFTYGLSWNSFTFSATETVDLLKNLSLDTQPKALEIPEPTKKPSVDTTGAVNGVNQPLDRSVTPLIPDFMDPTVAYFPNGYYYGGYDGTANDWITTRDM